MRGISTNAKQRSGALWEGRYKVSIVDAEGYLLSCMRYIELNPVRARMVRRPENYPWSSYAANAGGGGRYARAVAARAV